MGKHCTVFVYTVRLARKTHARRRTRAELETQMCEENPPSKIWSKLQTQCNGADGRHALPVALFVQSKNARGPVGAWLPGCGRTVGGPNLRPLPPTPQWLPPLPNHSFSAAAHISLQATATHHGLKFCHRQRDGSEVKPIFAD